MAKPGPRTTYRCSREFKATAVRLDRIPGVFTCGTGAESKDRLHADGLPTQRFAQGHECGDNEDGRQGCEPDE